jgi:DNA-binding NarL/FixJ family response regulator
MKAGGKKGRLGLPEEPPPGLVVRMLDGDGIAIASYSLEEDSLPDVLTPAERSVVAGALRAWSNGEIATARCSSTRTVANLLARAYRKLNVRSRAELAARLRPPSAK